MSVSLDSPGAAGAAATGLTGFFLLGDATGLAGVAGADFLPEAEGVCNIEMKNSMGRISSQSAGATCERKHRKQHQLCHHACGVFSTSPAAVDSDSAPRCRSCCRPQLECDWTRWTEFGLLQLVQV